jgi:hypothetical protein
MVCDGYLDLIIIHVIVIIRVYSFLFIYLIIVLKWRTFEHK